MTLNSYWIPNSILGVCDDVIALLEDQNLGTQVSLHKLDLKTYIGATCSKTKDVDIVGC